MQLQARILTNAILHTHTIIIIIFVFLP